MKPYQLALQLYTLRDFCQTEETLRTTLHRVREIGYQTVQASGLGPIDPAVVGRIAADADITVCATHEPAELLRRDPQKALEQTLATGAKLAAYPFPSGVDLDNPSHIEALFDDLQRAAEIYRAAGCRLSYHHHALEFHKIGARTMLEELMDHFPADLLGIEMDTYWVQFGGGNPVDWCRRCAGRISQMHWKDYAVSAKNEPAFAAIGEGNLDFAAIYQEAVTAGCEWFIVEQDVCPGDPFDAIASSLAYCRTHFFE